MKRYALSILLVTIMASVIAQAPNAFNYQAVIRNANGTVIANEPVSVQINILQGDIGGSSVYMEVHNTQTTELGLVNLVIGEGTTSGDLSLIDWSEGPYFIEVIVNGTSMGTSQLLSVPYAMYSEEAGNVFSGDYDDLTDIPLEFMPSAHTHQESEILDLQHYTDSDIDGTEVAFNGWDKNASDDFSGKYEDLTGKPDIKTYSVGDFAQGGIVFWVDESGQHGLVCAKEDQSEGTVLANGDYTLSMAAGDGPYAGEMNTMIIISKESGNSFSTDAASICSKLRITENGRSYADWYLPSNEELFLMYQNKTTINSTALAHGGKAFVTGSSAKPYWSSTLRYFMTIMASYYYFNDGATGYHAITNEYRVRAIRSF